MAAESQLIQILRQEGIVSSADLERALAHQRDSGAAVAEWLLAQGRIGENDLFFLLSRYLGVPAIPAERLNHLTLSPELRRRVPRALAESWLLIPLDYDSGQRKLSVAMCDPSDNQTLERLRQVARVDGVAAYLARRTDIRNTIRAIYSNHAEDRAGELQSPAPAPPAPDALDSAETGVELIPGKVSLDASLAREISRLPPGSRQVSADASRGPGQDDDSTKRPTLRIALPTSSSDHDLVAGEVETPPPLARREMTSAAPPPPPAAEVATSATPTLKIKLPPEALLEQPPADSAGGSPPAAALGGESGAKTPDDNVVSEQVGTRGRLDTRQLVAQLIGGMGDLAMALEQRAQPGASGVKDYGRLTELVGRELGLDPLAVSRTVLSAQLYGLDEALRRELGSKMRPDVAMVFSASPSAPGGLSARLRKLGSDALLLEVPPPKDRHAAKGRGDLRVVQLVSDYLELRGRADVSTDTTQLGQSLRDAGADAAAVAALTRVLCRLGGFNAGSQQGDPGEET